MKANNKNPSGDKPLSNPFKDFPLQLFFKVCKRKVAAEDEVKGTGGELIADVLSYKFDVLPEWILDCVERSRLAEELLSPPVRNVPQAAFRITSPPRTLKYGRIGIGRYDPKR